METQEKILIFKNFSKSFIIQNSQKLSKNFSNKQQNTKSLKRNENNSMKNNKNIS